MRRKRYLVDCSYICYFSGFSAFKQYKYNFDIRNTQLGPDFDPTLDLQFCEIFKETMEYSLLNPLRNNIPIIDKSKFIFCMDCPRKNIWRRDIYPEYKLQRDLKDNSKDEFNISKMFQYAYNVLLPGFCESFDAKQVMCGCAEGDDVIAVLTKYFLNETEDDVVIISCDKDMVQLSSDRVLIITADGTIRDPKLELEKALKQKIIGQINANDFLLYKIIIR